MRSYPPRTMNAPFAWPGGKSRLLKTLLARIPQHSIYVEVFSGSAKLLFAKEPSHAEVINDLNGEVMNFFRVVKHRAAELSEELEHEIVHPERFRELKQESSLDEVQRALRFAFTTWYSYGAKGDHFAAAALSDLVRGTARRPIDQVREMLERTSQRLSKVRIEQRDFTELLRRFDSPETFFYLDPPYVAFGNLGRYEPMTAERREELFGLLANLQGSFLLSFDNHPEIRELAGRYGLKMETAETRYGLGSTKASRAKLQELLVSKPAAVGEYA